MEQLSSGNTVIHRIHPFCKLLTCIAFIITVVSFGRYDFLRMIPFVFYTVILTALSEIPSRMLFKRFVAVLPFCFFIGLFGIFFERNTAFILGDIPVSLGVLAFVTLLYRAYLCITAMLLLVSVTPFTDLTAQMRSLKIPFIFITMFEMTYRYIGVLLAEVSSMRTAYGLRAVSRKGVDMRDGGGFVGHLLLRSFDRAERIYAAMKCRGYSASCLSLPNDRPRFKDIVFCVLIGGFCVLLRFWDAGRWFLSFAGGF